MFGILVKGFFAVVGIVLAAWAIVAGGIILLAVLLSIK